MFELETWISYRITYYGAMSIKDVIGVSENQAIAIGLCKKQAKIDEEPLQEWDIQNLENDLITTGRTNNIDYAIK